MIDKVKFRIDAFALAFGRISIAGSYGVLPFGALPMVTNDRINAAWDQRLRTAPPLACHETGPDCSTPGWAT